MQSKIIKKSLWTTLKSIPQSDNYTLFEKKSKLLVSIPRAIQLNHKKADVILVYKFSNNSWKKYKIQPTIDTKPRIVYPAAINGNKIYLISDMEELIMLELIKHTNQCTTQSIKNAKLGLLEIGTTSYSSTIIQDVFYYVSNRRFVKYNINTKKQQSLPKPSIQTFCYNCFIHIQNKLMLFGEIDYQTSSIQQYDIKNNRWKLLPIKLPNKIKFISSATILNEQMVLIIATADDKHCFLAAYEIQTNIIQKITISLPEFPSQIFAIHDKKKDALITNRWIQKNFEKIPICLTAVISNYYINEMIHLIDMNGRHYQIDTFQIVKIFLSDSKF